MARTPPDRNAAAAPADAVAAFPVAEWVQRLVRHPSEQTDLMEADPAVVGFIGDCVVPLVSDLGLAQRRDEMGNLIVRAGPERGERSLMFMAYAMTHPAAAMERPFAGERVEVDGAPAIRGRGVSEQKASLGAALAAVAAAHRSGRLAGPLWLAVSTAGETGRHDAAAAILNSLPAAPTDAVVCLGTSGRISLGNKGRVDVEITVRGRSAHSSTPDAGIDAIRGARRLLDRLDRLPLGAVHPTRGRPTLTATRIESFPRATHTVQDEVRLTLDRRLLPGQDPEAAFVAIRDAVVGFDPYEIRVTRGPVMYPCALDPDAPIVTAAQRGCAAAGLEPPELFFSNVALDAGYLQRQGSAAVMWGPGRMEQFHSNEEIVLVDELIRGARAYHGLIAALLMKP